MISKNTKTIKKAVLTLVAMLFITTIVSLPVEAKSTAINKTKVTVCTNKSYTLKIANTSKKVKWTTSDKKNLKLKPSGKKKENCKVTTSGKKGTYTVTAKVGKKKYKATVKVAGHKYGNTSYKWNKDYSKCTASKKCTRCGKTLKQTVKTTGKTTTKATCTETGTKKYTAQFSKYSFGTKAKSVTIKAKGHKVNADKKISYKWNSGYSKCTATYYCKNGGEKQKETVKASKKTTPATKTSEGKTIYTATFKTKGLQAQTKKVSIPKLAYLTLKGKEVNSVTIDYAHPAKITIANVDSDVKIEGTISEEEINQTNFYMDSTFAQSWWNNDPDWPDYANEYINVSDFRTVINKAKTSVTFKAIPPASDKTYNIRFDLSNGQTVNLKLTTKFTPGEYNFGEINMAYHGYHNTNSTPEFEEWYNYTYVAYGKNKGLYCWYKKETDSNGNGMYEDGEVITTKLTKTAPDGTVTELPVDSRVNTDYIMDCNTKAEYDEAYRFYHNQKARGGYEIDLNQKAHEIEHACNQMANYKSKAEIEWEALSYDVQESTYDGDIENFIYEKYGEVGVEYYETVGIGFGYKVKSNADLKRIVDAWTSVSGEKPSWYYNSDGSIYYAAFSDWAEWCGRDINAGKYKDCPALPDNFRD